MRSTKRPPARRASRKLNSAVRALPRCRLPLGLGAKRVTVASRAEGASAARSKVSDMLRIMMKIPGPTKHHRVRAVQLLESASQASDLPRKIHDDQQTP